MPCIFSISAFACVYTYMHVCACVCLYLYAICFVFLAALCARLTFFDCVFWPHAAHSWRIPLTKHTHVLLHKRHVTYPASGGLYCTAISTLTSPIISLFSFFYMLAGRLHCLATFLSAFCVALHQYAAINNGPLLHSNTGEIPKRNTNSSIKQMLTNASVCVCVCANDANPYQFW